MLRIRVHIYILTMPSPVILIYFSLLRTRFAQIHWEILGFYRNYFLRFTSFITNIVVTDLFMSLSFLIVTYHQGEKVQTFSPVSIHLLGNRHPKQGSCKSHSFLLWAAHRGKQKIMTLAKVDVLGTLIVLCLLSHLRIEGRCLG